MDSTTTAIPASAPPMRASSLAPMTPADIQRAAPSVFADTAHPKVSARYKFVRTADILGTLESAGFHVVQARQSASRTPDGTPYAKHSLRLAHADYLNGKMTVGDIVPQVIVTNSHDRSSAFQIEAGMFRLICSNGMMACSAEFTGVRVLHNDPDISDHIIDGTNLVREVTDTVALPMIERMQSKRLTKPQQIEFATAATLLKWGDARPDHAEALLAARRGEDEGDDVWRVLNRIQENAMRGGYTAKDRNGRAVKVRGIESVDRDRNFNVDLWTLGAQVVELA
jgi:hypothetical protein